MLTDVLPGDNLLELLSIGVDHYLVKPFELASATPEYRHRFAADGLKKLFEKVKNGLWDWNLTTQEV